MADGGGITTLAEQRKVIVDHLSANTVDKLEEFARDPIVLGEDVTPLDGFQLLTEKNVRACPVVSSDGKIFVGTLDLRDISKFFVESQKCARQKSGSKQKNICEMEPVKESDWRPLKPLTPAQRLMNMQDMANILPSGAMTGGVLEARIKKSRKDQRSSTLAAIACHPIMTEDATSLRYIAKMRPFKTFLAGTALSHVAAALASGSHIVGVTNERGDLTMVVTQKMLFQYVARLLTAAEWRVDAIMKSPVLSVGCQTSTLEAFQLMVEKNISGLAVTNEDDGRIEHNVSFRDIKSWVAGVRDDKDEETACDAIYEPQAAQGGEEAESAAGAQAQLLQESPEGKPREDWTELSIEDFIIGVRQTGMNNGKTRARVSVAQRSDTMGHVVKVLLATGFHHLWVVSGTSVEGEVESEPCSSSTLVGVVSFTDIFRQVCLPETAATGATP